MKEIRSAPIAAAEDMTLEGTCIVFEVPTVIHTEIGDFNEIVHRHALDGCDLSDSRLLYNHDTSKIPLARSGKTMQLTVSDRGLHMRASLAGDSPTARDVYSAVKRGDLSGMSFGFKVEDGGSRFDASTNTRHIDRITRVYEISVTPWPAYPTASVEARDEMTAARDAARASARARAQRIVALCRATRIIKEMI